MKKTITIIISVILEITLIVSFQYNFLGYNYDNAIDCVKNAANDKYSEMDKLVYVYENDSRALVIYTSKHGYYTSYCKKTKRSGRFYYKNIFLSNMIAPVTYHTEWNKVNKDLLFIYVHYKDDIKNIDCMGYEPVGSQIVYNNSANETKYCWLYVIDKTGKGSVTYTNNEK